MYVYYIRCASILVRLLWWFEGEGRGRGEASFVLCVPLVVFGFSRYEAAVARFFPSIPRQCPPPTVAKIMSSVPYFAEDIYYKRLGQILRNPKCSKKSHYRKGLCLYKSPKTNAEAQSGQRSGHLHSKNVTCNVAGHTKRRSTRTTSARRAKMETTTTTTMAKSSSRIHSHP